MRFAITLRNVREERGLSQSELGRIVGIHHTTICRWEKGSRNPTRKMVNTIAKGLKCNNIEWTQLLVSAGYLSEEIEQLLVSYPVLQDLINFLSDESVPTDMMDDFIKMISLLVRQAQRSLEVLNQVR
jgi:transcriptional regulator with XRE-family HTH domain